MKVLLRVWHLPLSLSLFLTHTHTHTLTHTLEKVYPQRYKIIRASYRFTYSRRGVKPKKSFAMPYSGQNWQFY
jgi:hypothetical protein